MFETEKFQFSRREAESGHINYGSITTRPATKVLVVGFFQLCPRSESAWKIWPSQFLEAAKTGNSISLIIQFPCCGPLSWSLDLFSFGILNTKLNSSARFLDSSTSTCTHNLCSVLDKGKYGSTRIIFLSLNMNKTRTITLRWPTFKSQTRRKCLLFPLLCTSSVFFPGWCMWQPYNV